MFQGFNDPAIRRLNRISKQIQNVTVRIPSHKTQENAVNEISSILPGRGRVNICYARNILLALQYAQTRYNDSSGVCMLDDIKNGKFINPEEYSKL